jgi:hypothetical protein
MSQRLLSSLILALCAGMGGCGDDDASAAVDAGGGHHEHDGGDPHDAALPDASEPDAAGDEDGGAEPPVEDTAYYPVTDGARWVYRHSGGSTWDEEVVLSHVTHEGKPAFMLRDTPGPSGKRSETVLARVGSQIARVYREELQGDSLQATATYDPGFARFDHAWVMRADGYTETLSYGRVERDAGGTITADGDRSHEYTIESHDETVEVPAGTFEDCLRVRRSRVRSDMAEPVEGDEDLFWFCPGVGKVREQDTVSLESEELVSFDILGQ